MGEQSIQLQVPEALYERVRQIAAESNRSVEGVFLDSIALLYATIPPTNELTLKQLGDFSDDQLWVLVYRPFLLVQDKRLSELTALSKVGRLNEEELAEMEWLIDEYDRYVLLRSQALLLLKQRGYDVERRLKLGA